MPSSKNKKPIARLPEHPARSRLLIGGSVAAAVITLLLFSGIASDNERLPSFFRDSKARLHGNKGTYIPLTLEYSIKDTETNTVRPGRYNDRCETGDIIRLTVTPGRPCRLMIFCIDSMRIPIPVFPSGTLAPRQVEAGTLSVPPLELNDVTGQEFYYAVAAEMDFTFREIASSLDTTLALLEGGNSPAKGPSTQVGELRLPGKFTSDFISFRHTGRQ